MNKTLQAALVIGAVDLISRGLDYVLGSPANGTNLEFSEDLTLTWGVACLVSAFIICLGVLFKNFKIAILGSLSAFAVRSEEHTSELQSRFDLVCRLLLEKK